MSPAMWHRAGRRTSHESARRQVTVVLAILLMLVCSMARAGDANVRLEMNKLETVTNACRAYLLVENRSGIDFRNLKLDLVMFDPDDIIANWLVVEAPPLPIGKTRVQVFDIPDLTCADLGKLLLNDVVACDDANGPRADCLGMFSTHTRGSVEFIK